MPASIQTIEPQGTSIADVVVLPRVLHHDPRGFLLETLRSDDAAVDGGRFAMSYVSLTVPGEKRDADRWHVHKRQVDRFVVLSGEMILMLHDARKGSATSGTLEAIRMAGGEARMTPGAGKKFETRTFMVTIPRGVYHCIGNLSTDPFVLQNYPTELYDPADEGRVPFASVSMASLSGEPFGWEKVEVRRP